MVRLLQLRRGYYIICVGIAMDGSTTLDIATNFANVIGAGGIMSYGKLHLVMHS